MTELRFDGRVAIVTGAGGNPGLGRSHAMLLAQRGAKVVVNDLGVGPDGRSQLEASAEKVAAEINVAGGEAIADLRSVAEEGSARAIVQTALDAWGRVDILVNNAGVGLVAGFDEISAADLQTVVSVHLMGDIWMCRAVWPFMRDAGYGRIVNTTSGAMIGLAGLTVYGAAKFGIYGLTRGLALEGAPYGIKVNAVSPGAYTNSLDVLYEIPDAEVMDGFKASFRTDQVSPLFGYLAHESCEVSGALFDTGGGNVTSTYLSTTTGVQDPELTIEGVRDHLATVLDEATLRTAVNPRDPLQRLNTTSSIMVARPYEPT